MRRDETGFFPQAVAATKICLWGVFIGKALGCCSGGYLVCGSSCPRACTGSSSVGGIMTAEGLYSRTRKAPVSVPGNLSCASPL